MSGTLLGAWDSSEQNYYRIPGPHGAHKLVVGTNIDQIITKHKISTKTTANSIIHTKEI
jgi:hypothetical protein